MTTKTSMSLEERGARRKQISEYVKENLSISGPENIKTILRKTARRFHVSMPTIKMACMEFGVKVPAIPKPPATTVRTLEIVRDLLAGKSQNEIAKAHGITRQWVFFVRQQAAEAGLLKD